MKGPMTQQDLLDIIRIPGYLYVFCWPQEGKNVNGESPRATTEKVRTSANMAEKRNESETRPDGVM